MPIQWEKYKIPTAILVLFLLVVVLIMLKSGVELYSKPLPVSNYNPAPQDQANSQESDGLGSEIYTTISSADSTQETNPFSQTTNPISGAYQNPFE